MDVSHIFRSYDVRGTVGKDLNEEIMEKIGLAFGNYVKNDIVIGRDVRSHSLGLKDAFVKGFLRSGKNVEDAGVLSMGSGMFHAWDKKQDFAYITGSHLPKECNGVKFFHGNGLGFVEEENNKIRDMFFSQLVGKGKGSVNVFDTKQAIDNYIKFLRSKIQIEKRLDVALDCANGCASFMAPQLFKLEGCEVTTLFGEPDGEFPNHLPDPVEEELGVLKEETKGKDIGIAYDGDADRTAIIDNRGEFMTVEETSYIILSELLKSEKGPIVANVECTRIIDKISSDFDRPIVRVPVGHTFLMQAVNKHRAAFGVERSGHFSIPRFIPFDDSVVVGLYVCHVLAKRGEKLSELRKTIPKIYFERKSYICPDSAKFGIMERLSSKLKKDFDKVNTIDGIRIDLENGWALLRVSNTGPVIRLTVEGSTQKDKNELEKIFTSYLKEEYEKENIKLETTLS